MHIPGELIDLILGHLSSNPGTLLNCTMVKRSWTHIARAHLIHKLSFRLAENSFTSGLTALAKCFSTDPLLAQYVSILEFGYIYTGQDTLFRQYLLVASLLAQMNRIRELRLIQVDWANIPQPISSAILALLSGSTISILHLEFFCMTSTAEFARLVSSPRSLRTLSLVQIFSRDRNGTLGMSADRKGGAVLRSLELSTTFNLHILDALLCAENNLNFSALRKLCLVHANHPSALEKLMTVVGSSIEELILSTKILSQQPVSFGLSLASMPKLLRLELMDGVTQEALESLFGSLEGPHPLREIVVHEDDWARHSLNAAQAYYLQPAFGALTRVEYQIMDKSTLEGMRHVYEEAFPMLCEKGLFFLVQEEPQTTWSRVGAKIASNLVRTQV